MRVLLRINNNIYSWSCDITRFYGFCLVINSGCGENTTNQTIGCHECRLRNYPPYSETNRYYNGAVYGSYALLISHFRSLIVTSSPAFSSYSNHSPSVRSMLSNLVPDSTPSTSQSPSGLNSVNSQPRHSNSRIVCRFGGDVRRYGLGGALITSFPPENGECLIHCWRELEGGDLLAECSRWVFLLATVFFGGRGGGV